MKGRKRLHRPKRADKCCFLPNPHSSRLRSRHPSRFRNTPVNSLIFHSNFDGAGDSKTSKLSFSVLVARFRVESVFCFLEFSGHKQEDIDTVSSATNSISWTCWKEIETTTSASFVKSQRVRYRRYANILSPSNKKNQRCVAYGYDSASGETHFDFSLAIKRNFLIILHL